MNTANESSIWEFWLGFAFGCLSITAFIAAAWSRDMLTWIMP